MIDDTLPASIVIYGKTLTQAGRGAYPYDCADKRLYPNAMVYKGDGCWTHEKSEAAAFAIKAASL